MRGRYSENVNKINGGKTNRTPQIDFPNGYDQEKREQREKTEENISDKARLVNRNMMRANQNTYNSDNNTRYKEGTSQNAV